MKSKFKILIIEDEDDLRKVLEFNLQNENYQTLGFPTGEEGLAAVESFSPDLILLDLMLPGIQGIDVCKTLKADLSTAAIPIVFLTARGEEIDRIVGFEVGAEDYVVKPFSVRELLLRVKTILKRHKKYASEDENVVTFATIKLDTARRRVHVDDKETDLTATEFRLLKTFLGSLGEAKTREELLEKVWGDDISLTIRTVDTHVKRLREKLGESGKYIETVRGFGYRFSEEP